MVKLYSALLAAFLLLGAGAGPAGAAGATIWYYPQSGHSMTMGFARFVGDLGGTDLAGLPITEEIEEHGVVVQYFQNLRLEWHPQRPAGKRVVVGTLGLELGKAQPPVAAPTSGSSVIFFPGSGHTLADGFLAYYEAHAGPTLLGAPISEELVEHGAVVQYFSNAELQWRAGSAVTLGTLGSTAATARGWTVQAPPLAPIAPPAGAKQVTAGVSGPVPSVPIAPDMKSVKGIARPVTVLPGTLTTLDLPVLMYHHIGSWPSAYSVSTANFTAQLDWLQANGYQAINLRQAYAAIYGTGEMPAKPVVLSIDDGYPDAATNARQVLLQHHMTATFFIPTVQSPLAAATLRQMDREGFDLEAHSRTHPDLTRLNDTAAWNEIAGSKQDLERILGHQVDLFAYPYGAVNGHVVALLQRAGFRGGILASGGRSYSTAYPFAEPRIMVDRGDDLANFIAKVVGRPYRNTLQSISVPNSKYAVQPNPEFRPAPAPTGSSRSGSSGNGGYAGTASPPDTGARDSGATGSDPTSGPVGHGAIYV